MCHDVRRLPEESARFYAAEVLLTIEYLHKQNIIYRDLKVLVDADRPAQQDTCMHLVRCNEQGPVVSMICKLSLEL